ncbi:MAG: DUF2934 domain-containing protein [Nitrospirota bacterium]
MSKGYEEEIAKVAYDLHQKRGGQHGDDQRDWFDAEKIVMSRHQKSNQETKTSVQSKSKRRNVKAA